MKRPTTSMIFMFPFVLVTSLCFVSAEDKEGARSTTNTAEQELSPHIIDKLSRIIQPNPTYAFYDSSKFKHDELAASAVSPFCKSFTFLCHIRCLQRGDPKDAGRIIEFTPSKASAHYKGEINRCIHIPVSNSVKVLCLCNNGVDLTAEIDYALEGIVNASDSAGDPGKYEMKGAAIEQLTATTTITKTMTTTVMSTKTVTKACEATPTPAIVSKTETKEDKYLDIEQKIFDTHNGPNSIQHAQSLSKSKLYEEQNMIKELAEEAEDQERLGIKGSKDNHQDNDSDVDDHGISDQCIDCNIEAHQKLLFKVEVKLWKGHHADSDEDKESELEERDQRRREENIEMQASVQKHNFQKVQS
ncbi:hypothetical protein BX616_001003 [Lobosporangium transversale]|uniref:Cyanovirin-N domain-containing protein n=1 Tax=Lobosporangium transversale TaxID=64571 RepID=A0A1Y2GAZ6_9FUNG|nr:hypothetical protein BCR41DRAFT_362336 [Lobosporangium transversale]KAF9905513.1 hypothetical protein BX616_001003 [Lobosporangium transversale]ORZ04858.1 hypothetical protein BCR41DRAFT_362336 [Lobosporangium transversale]|eukprot:XP_021876795.1 hypothetical protein BCR41DRAFT_362336 [Lobosporangium transversale]